MFCIIVDAGLLWCQLTLGASRDLGGKGTEDSEEGG